MDNATSAGISMVADAVTSSMATTATTALAQAATSSPRSSFLANAALSTVQALPRFLLSTVSFASITLPTWLFTLFSTSLTVTLNFTTIMLIALAFTSTASWLIRYRYLNMYARLPPEPQRKEPQIDLFPETQAGDSKRGLSNYLDEFLSAIKVFGYLERPVFHELTRTMQTRKLIAGETLNLEEEQGFCLVVDGLVQIFVKSKRNASPHPMPQGMGGFSEDEDDEEDGQFRQGYQLLTEVKNGAPMSSLFSILSLFTEDVKLRYNEDESTASNEPMRPPSTMRNFSTARSASGVETPASEGEGAFSPNLGAQNGDYERPRSSGKSSHLPSVPPMTLDPDQDGYFGRTEEIRGPSHAQRAPLRRRMTESAHPDIVARATVDTTIAIIPAAAFRRLTRVYPRASAHIVQVILTRLQRVTLSTGHAYLGLTSEVSRIEKLMNRYTSYDLPGFLRGSALERLKEKFSAEKERIGLDEGVKGIALHNSRATRQRRSSSSLRKEAAAHARLAAARLSSRDLTTSDSSAVVNPSVESERTSVHAGDLLTNAQSSRRGSRAGRFTVSQPFHTISGEIHPPKAISSTLFTSSPRGTFHRQESLDEDSFFRDSIVDCMLKAIGLTNAKGALQQSDSVEQSPRLASFDARRHKQVFDNAFGGFMNAFEGDSDSVTSVPASSMSAHGGGDIKAELSTDVEIVFFPKGAVLVEQGERNPGLYYVIDGFLDVSVPGNESNSDSNPFGSASQGNASSKAFTDTSSRRTMKPHVQTTAAPVDDSARKKKPRRSLYLTKPGGLAGYLGTISSRRSFVDVVAKTDVYVGFLPRASIERMVEKYPIVLLTMAKRLTSLLPRLILHIDFALEWVQVDAGQAIYHQGDDSDAIYIVLNGRLRIIKDGVDGKLQVLGEYGQGDSVGELEVLTESPRPGTLHAIRDTELAKLPKTLFNSLALENPEITIKVSRTIAQRMRDLAENPALEHPTDRTSKATNSLVSSTVNLRTVTVLPVTAGVPVTEFASRLVNALTQIGTPNGVTSLDQAAILNHLGRHAFSRLGKLKLSQHLADLEEKYGLVLYVADTNVNSPWTQTCISQADCILLVGVAEGSPAIGEYERYLLTTKTTARKELVLLHAERYCPQGLTRNWLRNRVWINGSHHHIHMAFRTATEPVHPQLRRFGTALKQRVQVIQAEIQKYTSRKVRQTPLYSAETPFKGDFHRLGRRLTGKSVGLVLGGGGARGISHIGIIRAMEEAGIPIDIVGGTSIGAFVGALYAWDADVVPMYGRAKKFAGRMGSMWRFALDLTYPSASYTTGHEFNRGIFKTFGTAQIEDFWLEFYCNATDISKSRQRVLRSGYAWRYVRASMSLAGLVPPLCDEGSMLLDGGYLDNLTVSHMKSLGADVIFAVDVGAIDDQTPQAYGDSLSGFAATFNRWNPFSATPNPPTLSEIQGRLAYVSSIDALERAKVMPGCRYLRPPVVDYGTLDFGKFEEIYQVGYRYGREFMAELRDQGVLPVMEETEEKRNLRRTMAPRRASI